jgi:hypothetical protein
MVSLPRSAEKMPVDRTVNANTDATTTNAIRMMAVSRPVTPFSVRWTPETGQVVKVQSGS